MSQRALSTEGLELEGGLVKKIYVYSKALSAIHRRPMYTRELLAFLSNWGDSFELLKELELKGFVERRKMACSEHTRRICVYNFITPKGKEFLRHVLRIVELIGG